MSTKSEPRKRRISCIKDLYKTELNSFYKLN